MSYSRPERLEAAGGKNLDQGRLPRSRRRQGSKRYRKQRNKVASRTFDGRLQLLEYVPTVLAGPPGTNRGS